LKWAGSLKKVYADTSGWGYTTWKPTFNLQRSMPPSS
jgi:hypothetical protein